MLESIAYRLYRKK